MRKKFASAIALAGLSTATFTAPVATAADVAPGAPMRIKADLPTPEGAPEEINQAICTNGVPGTVILEDGTEKNVMITAAHCVYGIEGDTEEAVDMKPEVYTPTPEGNKLIGHREAGRKVSDGGSPAMLTSPDWATIALEDGVTTSSLADSIDKDGRPSNAPVVITGVRDYPDLKEGEISFDDTGKPICKHGQTTGHTCGVQLFRVKDGIWYLGHVEQGDSGGIVYDPETGEALGVSSMYLLFVFQRAQTADIAIEEAYGIPDGQVNERFRTPESTEPSNPVRSMAQDQAVAQQWEFEQLFNELPTWNQASETVQNNVEASIQDGKNLVNGVQNLPQNPANATELVDQAQESLTSWQKRANDSAEAIVGAGIRGILDNAPAN